MELLNKIQQELKVAKNRVNSFSKYNYRNAEDILEAVKPLLDDAVLILEDEIVQLGERYYVKATAKLMQSRGDKTAVASATAYAREALEKKGMDEAQITGAASSYARKYALNGLFCIDDTEDADTQDNTAPKTNPIGKPSALTKPAVVVAAEQKELAQKKEIQKLCDDKALAPLLSKQDYKEYILNNTGLVFGEAKNEEIIERLKTL